MGKPKMYWCIGLYVKPFYQILKTCQKLIIKIITHKTTICLIQNGVQEKKIYNKATRQCLLYEIIDGREHSSQLSSCLPNIIIIKVYKKSEPPSTSGTREHSSRYHRECILYKNNQYISTFQSINAACRFAAKQYNASYSMLNKHRKWRDIQIVMKQKCNDQPKGVLLKMSYRRKCFDKKLKRQSSPTVKC